MGTSPRSLEEDDPQPQECLQFLFEEEEEGDNPPHENHFEPPSPEQFWREVSITLEELTQLLDEDEEESAKAEALRTVFLTTLQPTNPTLSPVQSKFPMLATPIESLTAGRIFEFDEELSPNTHNIPVLV